MTTSDAILRALGSRASPQLKAYINQHSDAAFQAQMREERNAEAKMFNNHIMPAFAKNPIQQALLRSHQSTRNKDSHDRFRQNILAASGRTHIGADSKHLSGDEKPDYRTYIESVVLALIAFGALGSSEKRALYSGGIGVAHLVIKKVSKSYK